MSSNSPQKAPPSKPNTHQQQTPVDRVTTRQITQQEFFEGPIPHPSILEQMERVLPGSAERIFRMAEKDQENAHAAQRNSHERAIAAEQNAHEEQMTQLWMGFASLIILIAIGGALIYFGHKEYGGPTIVTTLGIVVVAFLKYQRKK